MSSTSWRIPVIAASALAGGPHPPLVAALRSVGFVFVDGLLDKQLVKDTLAASKWFFAQPQESKEAAAAVRPAVKGYYRFAHESGPGDNIECFAVENPHTSTLARRGPYFSAAEWPKDMWPPELKAPMRWPTGPGGAEFRSTVTKYFDAASEGAMKVLHCIGLEGGRQRANLWTAAHSRADHAFELKHYPPHETPGVRMTAHYDLTTLTLLSQDVVSGLEVWDPHTEAWQLAPAEPGLVLVNVGDILASWDPSLTSTKHRVVARPETATMGRHSLVFFVTPNWDAPATASPDASMCGDLMPFQ